MTGVDFVSLTSPPFSDSGAIGTVDWAITPLANTFPDHATARVTSAYEITSAFGEIVTEQSFAISPLFLTAGTYFLVLQNAGTPNFVYWDLNGGPSTAYDNVDGPILSESFQILGTDGSPPIGGPPIDLPPPPTPPVADVPEPAAWSMMLLGFAGLGAVLRASRRRAAARAA